ncbi:helix-turn-helix domain-containing protein [Caryophanon tenue]|uniref:HTH cro/C1-type domain-containing protein n=1 Tax=Caryophanon tenue TaxID=33978 RepID=A0A1C0YC77_9BACL|nr:helix-turn-helix transcriptional regulator [Caryophanon tenue]OCS84751.1 hypothetical protein A6M13_04005 [Caryophanon tenue]
MHQNIGEKIRHLRIHKGLSQGQLIEGLCSVAYLSKVENGKTKPSSSFLARVAARLQVSVAVIDPSSSDDFLQRVEEVLARVEQRTETLQEDDEALLKMVLLEFVPQYILIRVVTVLLKHYLQRGHVAQAEAVYEAASKLMDLQAMDVTQHQHVYFHLHNVLGKYFYMKDHFAQADYHFLVAEQCIDERHQQERAKIYYNISLVKQRLLEDKSIAIFYSERAYELFMKQNDRENVINALITLGVQYHFAQQFERSLHVLEEAERYIEQSASPNKASNEVMIKYNIGRVHQSIGNEEQAIAYYEWCLAQAVVPTYKAHILKSLVEIYVQLKQWECVKNLLEETLQLTETHAIRSLEIDLQCMQAEVFQARGDEQSYELHLKKALELAEQHENFLLIKRIATQLGTYYYDQRFYKKAAMFYAKALKRT